MDIRSGDVQSVVETVNPTPKNMYGARRHGERSTSRMCVLVCFLDLVSSHRLVPLDACHRVFLLQACPPSLANSKDLFVPIAKVTHSFTDETLRHTAGKSFRMNLATPSRKFCMAPVTRHVYSSPLVQCTMSLVFIGSSIDIQSYRGCST